MIKFVKKFLFFSLIPVALVITMDVWLRNMNSVYKEKFLSITQKKDSIQVLILGNSHAAYGIAPAQFSLYAYNLANVNQSLYFDEQLTRSFINDLPKLKFVFISVDFHSLNFSSQGLRDAWSYYANGIKYKNKNYILENISPFLFGYTPKVSFSLLKKYIHNSKYSPKKTFYFDVENGASQRNFLEKGLISFDGEAAGFNEQSFKSKAADFNDTYKHLDERPEILADLDSFILFLKTRNITPVLFAAPTFKGYNVYLDKSCIRQNQEDINGLCKKYNIEYWDYTNSDQFEKEDFYNCDHLNTNGAVRFSKILNERMRDLK